MHGVCSMFEQVSSDFRAILRDLDGRSEGICKNLRCQKQPINHISHPPPNSSPTNDPRIRGDFEHPHIGFPSASPRQLARFAHPRREQRKIPSVKRKISAGTFKNKTPSTASRSRGRFCRLDASPLAVAPQTGSRMDAREISTRCACLFTPIFPSNIPSNDRP
jgi:hypothetical protein